MKRTHIPFLIEVAESLNCSSLVSELQFLKAKAENPNTPIVLPLIGEFSSGKTTLINALTDSQALETATRPTTATIFEVHFGAPSNCADILYEDGRQEHTDDIKSLVNDRLGDAKVVTVYDKSTKVSPYTILVDTPGLSSPETKHKQVLVDFLPSADAVLLVIDINQQLTKSLIEFLKTVKLTDKKVYMVLTKSDTKSPEEVKRAKNYMAQNCEIGVGYIAAVSATKGDVQELSAIFEDIELKKEDIVRKADEKRLDIIADSLKETISQYLEASKGHNEIEDKIIEQKQKLEKIRRQIEKLIRNVGDMLEPLNMEESRKFEDQIFTKLSSLVNSGSNNYDAEAINAINITASAILGDYRQKVMSILAQESASMSCNSEISVSSVPGIDLSSLSISGLSYGLNLNEMGHEYDRWIKTGVIAVGAIGAAYAVGAVAAGGAATAGGAAAAEGAATAGGAAAGGAATAAEGALTLGAVVDIADTVTDVGSVINNRKVAKRIENAVKYGKQTAEQYAAIDQFNQQGYGEPSSGKGMIDSLVGFIAEKTMSKPKRNYAIRQYIDGTLMPEFKSQISMASTQVLNAVRSTLDEAATSSIEEGNRNLTQLKEQLQTQKEEVMRRMESLRKMQSQLIILN